MIRRSCVDDKYFKDIGLDNLESNLQKNVIYVCSNILEESPLEYHKKQIFINQDMYNISISLLCSKYPELYAPLQRYLNGKKHYWSNMFLCSKTVFFELCEWIFPKLFFVYERLDFKEASVAEHRFIGYLAENLFGVFWELQSKKGRVVKSLPISFVEQTDISVKLPPAFLENNISICFSCDKNYPPYLTTAIQSIVDHSSEKNNYDIVILEDCVSWEDQQKIQTLIRKNISIRFVNMAPFVFKYKDYICSRNFAWYTSSIYFRYFIPIIFNDFKKVLYLDCDVVLLADVALLYNTELNGHIIGAVKDIERRRWLKDINRRKQTLNFDKELGICDSREYFNSGVCLFNIPKMQHQRVVENLLEMTRIFNSKQDNWYGDQDILNGLFYGDVCFIDESWNVMWVVNNRVKDYSIELDAETCSKYKKSLQKPRLIHYCDKEKPWLAPNIFLAHHWWNCARKSPYYEFLLLNLCSGINARSHINDCLCEKTVIPKQDKKVCRTYTHRRFIKQFVPYGVMCYWLRKRYQIEEDRTLLAYPGLFKKIRRFIKFSMPYGIICNMKKGR